MRTFTHPLLLGLLALAGCTGRTSLHEHHTYLVSDPSGQRVSLLRVIIEGSGNLAEVNYQAGWRETAAVDEVFKDQPAPFAQDREREDEVRRPIHEARKKIVQALSERLAQYAQNLRQDDSTAIEATERALVQALSLERRLRARETGQVPEAPAEKYTIVFSADPDRIFAELAAVAERQRNEGALVEALTALSLRARQADSEERRRDRAAIIAWKAIGHGLSARQVALGPPPKPEAESRIRADYNQRELSLLVQQLTAYRLELLHLQETTP